MDPGASLFALGRPVLIEGPSGRLTTDVCRGQGVTLIASGIGITPLRAPLEELDGRSGPVNVIYRTSEGEELIFASELEYSSRERGVRAIHLPGSRARGHSWLPAKSEPSPITRRFAISCPISPPTSAPHTTAPPVTAPPTTVPRNLVVNGQAYQTRWGIVQVQVTISGGRVADVTPISLTAGNRHDQAVNAVAVPILRQQAIATNSANLDTISGATITSTGYILSLQSALDAANLHK